MLEYHDRRAAEYDEWYLGEGKLSHFLAEAHRIAPELIVVVSAASPDHAREERQEASSTTDRAAVFKRYFAAEDLAAEPGGADVVYESPW